MNAQMFSDQVLLERYLQGDCSAISSLIERHSRRVRDYIRMMVKDADLADDIFQETFIKVVRVIDEGRYNDNGKFLSWVLRIAHNKVIDHFRAQRQATMVSESSAGYNVLGTMRFAEQTVEDRIVGEQIDSELRNLVGLLPDEQREVVEKFITDNGYTFGVGLDPERAIYDQYASNFVPRTFIINKRGKVTYRVAGYDEQTAKAVNAAIAKALR